MPLTPPRRSATNPQHGVTLIEVLVALFVFAVGFLGAAALQLSSLRASQFTNHSVVASQFTHEYGEITQLVSAEAITASTTTTGNFSDLVSAFETDSTTPVGASPTSCVGASKTCSAEELVKFMQWDWGLRVQQKLPAGEAKVCRDKRDATNPKAWACTPDGAGEMLIVKMRWKTKKNTAVEADNALEWMANKDNEALIALPVMGGLKDYRLYK